MPVKRIIPHNNGIFFITFTCHRWLPLIDKINGYDIIYQWFNYLKSKGHFINGYVIMPNHIHVLISFIEAKQSINIIIGNGKRFMAYQIIKRLKLNNQIRILEKMEGDVSESRKINNKRHEVWELSFDWKDCRSNYFVYQKLDYMHNNPFVKKWALCNNPLEYIHSSAQFYLTGVQGLYPITNFMEMEDLNFDHNKFR